MSIITALKSKFSSASPVSFPIADGIDVSTFQGNIDWEKVRANGIKFAMIRMGFGSYTGSNCKLDKCFETNVANATKAGVDIGCYFYTYATSTTAIKAEADFVVQTLSSYPGVFTYPIALDMEDPKVLNRVKDKKVLTDMILTFVNTLESAGYYCSVYANRNWFDNLLNDSKLQRVDHWLAEWNLPPKYKNPYGLWQYTSSSTVPGISGRVDKNKAFKDYPSIIKSNKLNGFGSTSETVKPIPSVQPAATPSVTPKPVAPQKPQPVFKFKKGDKVYFKGSKQFASSTKSAKPSVAKPGWATITLNPVNGAHPYHIVHTDNKSNVYGWVNKSDILSYNPNTSKVTPKPVSHSTIKVGDRVKVKKGAKTYNGGSLASFVYTTTYTVSEIKGTRAVITYKGQVTAAIHVKNLIKI